jgi:hypothetical protein
MVAPHFTHSMNDLDAAKGSIGDKCVSTPIKLPAQTKVSGLFDAVIRSDYCRNKP